MFFANILLLVAACNVASRGAVKAQAITSMYIPGFDPQPLEVSEVSVSGDHTIWELGPGSLTGTFSETDFPATATLIIGPSDVLVSLSDPVYGTIIESCTIGADGLATCALNEGSTTETDTETASPFAVQLGATLTDTGAPASTPAAQPSGSAGAGTGSSGKPSLTPSPKPAPTSGSGASQTGAPAPSTTSGALNDYAGVLSFALAAAVLSSLTCFSAL